MRKFLTMAVLLALTGCASLNQAPQGITLATPAISQALASEAAEKLFTAYPPAATEFFLAESARDAFGQAFTGELRTKGFAVAETPTSSGVSLGYMVDSYGQDLFRVTLNAGPHTYSRAFNKDQPIGVWSKRENQ